MASRGSYSTNPVISNNLWELAPRKDPQFPLFWQEVVKRHQTSNSSSSSRINSKTLPLPQLQHKHRSKSGFRCLFSNWRARIGLIPGKNNWRKGRLISINSAWVNWWSKKPMHRSKDWQIRVAQNKSLHPGHTNNYEAAAKALSIRSIIPTSAILQQNWMKLIK